MKLSWIIVFIVLEFSFSMCANRDADKNPNLGKKYYPNGKLKSVVSYKDSLLDGKAVYYYPNGNIKSQATYTLGVQVNEEFGYYKSGNLEHYLFFDVRGNLRYKIYFDVEGNKVEEKGKPIYLQVIGNKQKNYLGDTITIVPMVGNPYKGGYQIEIYETTYDKKRSLIAEFEFSGGTPLYEHIADAIGDNSLTFLSKIVKDNKVVRVDSAKVKLRILEKK